MAATSHRTGPSARRPRGARRGAGSCGRRRRSPSAAASARVIWRVAGRAVKGAGTSPVRAAIHDRTFGRQAPPWHGPRQAWLARLSSSSSVNPRSHASARSATVVPMQPQTTPSLGGGGRGWSVAASPTTVTGTDPAIRARSVARREAQVDDDGVGRRRRLGAARRIGRHHGRHTAGLALEADRVGIDRDDPAHVHAGGAQLLGGTPGHEPGQPVARADRVDLGRARRDDDLVRVEMEHAVRGSDDDHRAGVDRDHLVAGPCVEDADRLAGTFRLGGRGEAGRTSADDRHVDLEVVEIDPRRQRRRGQVGRGHHGEWRVRPGRMPRDPQPRSCLRLAGPDVRGAVDLRQAVAAVAGQAQRPAAPGHLAPTHDGDRHRVARLERDRSPVDDDPAATGRHGVGHWRIRRPCGSNSGSGCSRAGRRSPMISISKPSPPGPSAVASSVGTYPSAIDFPTWCP